MKHHTYLIQDYILKTLQVALLEIADNNENQEIEDKFPIEVTATKQISHGDYSTNIAMILAKKLKKNPREIASEIINSINQDPTFDKIEIAGAGFINFTLSDKARSEYLSHVLEAQDKWGWIKNNSPKNINVEFVSVNPNGPVTIGSGRGAAFGDSLCRTLTAAGENVHREFYINDSMNSEQMRLFAESVRHYTSLEFGIESTFPEKGYKGDYVSYIGKEIADTFGKESLEKDISWFQEESQTRMIEWQKRDLEKFGVKFNTWFSEQSLHDNGKVEACLEELKKKDLTYEKDGATWLKSTQFGDDKDRVLVRSNDRKTYVTSDTAYHQSKFERGADVVIDILGPDHHGYIGRMNAVIQALGKSLDVFDIIIYQVVRFVKNGESVPMRKRDGTIYELGNLTDEIGVDNTRFFFLMRSHDTHLDFDIELAVRESDENPVFYTQYAHARICSILKKAEEQNLFPNPENMHLLNHEAEKMLVKSIFELPNIIQLAASDYGVHRFAHYSIELARLFHSFYDKCKVVQPEFEELTSARLALCQATMYTLQSAFWLLGVSAPQRMYRK